MDGIALNQERARVVKVLFRRPGTHFRRFDQRRRLTELAFVVGGEERFAETRPQRIAEEVEIADALGIRQRLMSGGLYGIAIDGGDRRQILLNYRLRQRSERREQRNTRLLVGFCLEVITAGLQPCGIRLGFILSGVFELVASQSYRIALQRVAQLRQALALQRIKRRAGGGWRHAVGDCRRLIQRNLFRQRRQRQH